MAVGPGANFKVTVTSWKLDYDADSREHRRASEAELRVDTLSRAVW